jgi:hypothetical protein
MKEDAAIVASHVSNNNERTLIPDWNMKHEFFTSNNYVLVVILSVLELVSKNAHNKKVKLDPEGPELAYPTNLP